MPFPVIPVLIYGGLGLAAGLTLAGENNDAQVIVNPAPANNSNNNFRNALLLGAAGIAAVVVVPKIIGS